MPEKNAAFSGRPHTAAHLTSSTTLAALPEQDFDLGAYRDRTNEVSTTPATNEHLLALRKLLQSHDYDLALVHHIQWNHLLNPKEKPFSIAPAAVLLPVAWKAFVLEAPTSTVAMDTPTACFGEVCIDFLRMEVTRGGEIMKLTAQEFKILKCLVAQPHRVFSRDELLNQAWGYRCYPTTRTVDNHFFKLRQKLEKDPARPVHFRTIHRIGYKFVPEPENKCQSLTRLPHLQQRRIQPALKRLV